MYSDIERIQPIPLPELRARYIDRGIPVIIQNLDCSAITVEMVNKGRVRQ